MKPGLPPRALLCDADGNLFPSEEPAFDACADVANRLGSELGVDRVFTGEDLRLVATGRNFRSIASELIAYAGRRPARSLEHWVEEERIVVTAHLARVLRPDAAVARVLEAAADDLQLAVVSSSARPRIDACLEATDLADLFPAVRRFSAEDSLPSPRSKPDPSIYLHAVEQLRVAPEEALAVEDSVPGVRSAARAGVPVLGNVVFVPLRERAQRERELRAAGAVEVVNSWAAVAAWAGLDVPAPPDLLRC